MDTLSPELPLDPAPELPDGHTARIPVADDLEALVALVDRQRASTPERGSVDAASITAEVVGQGSWTRRQILVEDAEGGVCAWVSVHDRAAGRSDLRIVVDPDCPERDALASGLFAWTEAVARVIAAERDVTETRLELLLDAGDEALKAWAAEAGHVLTRTWLNMYRPVTPDDISPTLRPGVVVRRVGVHDLGDGTTVPVAEDLQTVHRMLEESFEDHFNSYSESFTEFTQRLREDPGHRWDHWWLALIDDDGQMIPGGALVSTSVPADDSGAEGSYVDYIGVHRRARGRGVAKALLLTVIADAAERGRSRVGLEVDDDSPTGADGLYRSMGWESSYVTQSWHKDLDLTDG